jgi:prepilin-type processing-associated H-X9-DG protein
MILSPHLDDAVLSCWSVLSGSRKVEVVNVFTGAPSASADIHIGELLMRVDDAAARARERAAEDRAALRLVGARPHNLDLPEYPHWTQSAGLARSRWRHLARRLAQYGRSRASRDEERLRGVMQASAPHIDRQAHIYAPAALGGNPDHELVRELGCRLLREGVRVSFYADQPYCYAYGWPHWVIGEAPDPYLDRDRYWGLFLDGANVSFADLHVDVVCLDRAHEEKVRALRLYRTQFTALEGGANHRVSNPALTGWEVFWHSPGGLGRPSPRAAQVPDRLSQQRTLGSPGQGHSDDQVRRELDDSTAQ